MAAYNTALADLDYEDVDHWAINIVVKEGAYMALNTAEKVVACHQMSALGITLDEMAERLHSNRRNVSRYLTAYRKVLARQRDMVCQT